MTQWNGKSERYLGDQLDQGLVNYFPRAKSSPCLFSKVVLAYSQVHLLIYYLWLLLHCSRVEYL